MLPVNDYQKVLYEALKKTNYKVFDEVPADEDLPLMMISDYTLDEGNTKLPGYKIVQSIDLYSQYNGKKEINTMVALALEEAMKLENAMINDNYCISWVRLNESVVQRMEDGLYVAYLKIQFELEEVI